MSVPIIIGAAGHIDIFGADKEKLAELVRGEILSIMREYPASPVHVMTSLAEGADMLCANAALDCGAKLIVPLPMDAGVYSRDFKEKEEFEAILARAQKAFVVRPKEPQPEGEIPAGFYYRQAGLYVAENCHILLALWDGEEKLTAGGGGTFETVDFMRRRDGGGQIVHIKTSRQSGPDIKNAFLVEYTKNDCDIKSCKKIDAFNRDTLKYAEHIKNKAYDAIPGAEFEDIQRGELYGAFAAADTLSVMFSGYRLAALRALSLLGLAVVLAFLLYDEMESDLMLFLFGGMAAAAFITFRRANRGGWHRKYLEYRVMAEAFRVQLFWRASGVGGLASRCYSFTQRGELDFVTEILRGAVAAEPCHEIVNSISVCEAWTCAQIEYSKSSKAKKTKQDRINGKITNIVIIFSAALFFVLFAMEIWAKNSINSAIDIENLRGAFLLHEGQGLSVRGTLKIALGALSAAAAFLANYYGKLSLKQQIYDNQRMYELHIKMRAMIIAAASEGRNASEYFEQLGREEMQENAGWFIFQRDNSPELVLF